MKKLKLQMDGLRVESFATRDEPVPDPGTVRAHAEASAADAHTCGCPPTYAHTCHHAERTCARTCACPSWSDCNTYCCPSWSGAECNTVCIG